MSERTEKGLLNRTLAWLERNLWWILIGVAVIFAVVVWYLGQNDGKSELIRTVVLGVIGIGGFYGLVMAKQRLDRFSKQVETQIKQADTAQEQLFNERLGRGVELLKDDNVIIRSAGIRVLWDLGKTSSQEQAKLIVEIVHNFVDQKTQPDYKKDKNGDEIKDSSVKRELKPAKDRAERRDIELAIFALAELIENAKMMAKDIPFNGLDLRGLHFHDLEWPNIIFLWTYLDRAVFFGAKLNGANFMGTNLHGAYFNKAELHKVNFNQATLCEVNFGQAELYRANLIEAKLNGADFFCTKLVGADCSYADFNNAQHLDSSEIKYIVFQSWGIIGGDIEESKPQNLPNGITVPEDRAYDTRLIFDGGKSLKQFVKSTESWSEQHVDEWIEQEIAKAKENTRSPPNFNPVF